MIASSLRAGMVKREPWPENAGLVQRAQAGDKVALYELWNRMRPLLKRRVRYFFSRAHYDNDDLWQDVFLVFRTYVMGCPLDVPIHAYLSSTVGGSVFGYVGRQKLELDRYDFSLDWQEEDGAEDNKEYDSWRGRVYHRGFDWMVAREMLACLPSEDYRVLVLMRYYGFTRTELSGMVGVSLRKVDLMLSKVRHIWRLHGYDGRGQYGSA